MTDRLNRGPLVSTDGDATGISNASTVDPVTIAPSRMVTTVTVTILQADDGRKHAFLADLTAIAQNCDHVLRVGPALI